MVTKIQVAFQGGGAKLIPLLAVTDALRRAEEKGQIEVTRVAGTSAGAIAACIFATGEPIHPVRQHLRDKGQSYITALMPASLSLINPMTLYRVCTGRPLVDERRFKSALSMFFSIFDKSYRTFSDLKIPVKITAAELVNQKLEVFDKDETIIADALMHSCGLPFLFKSVKNLGDPAYVDGGICENLPSEVLSKDPSYGGVIGVSFRERGVKHRADSVARFAMSLLNTAINNSMERAKRRLPNRILYIDTPLGTFDARKAISEPFLGLHYDAVLLNAEKWLNENISQLDREDTLDIAPRATPPEDTTFQSRLFSVYGAQHSETSHRMIRAALVVVANCLLPEEDPRHSVPDEVKQIYEFALTDEPMYCFSISLESGGESEVSGPASWKLHDGNHKEHDVIVLPVVDESRQEGYETQSLRHVLVFFTPPLQPGEGNPERYTLVQKNEVRNAMIELKTEGSDFLAITTDRPVTTEEADLVLFVPEEFANLEMQMRVPRGITRKILQGREMTPEELLHYGDPPIRFRAIGWSGENLTRDNYLGVDVYVAQTANKAS